MSLAVLGDGGVTSPLVEVILTSKVSAQEINKIRPHRSTLQKNSIFLTAKIHR